MKVLIIDDEQYIREGLKVLIDWESLGCHLIGEAKNGIEGIEKIRELDPDLCIIDIRMPGLDGTQVIEATFKEKIECQFIVLTGHKDFDSVTRAMECQVNKYILKPIDEVVLKQKIKEVYEEWRKKGFHKSLVEQSKEQVIRQFILGEPYKERYLNERYDLSLPWQTYQVVLLIKQNGYFTSLEKTKIKVLLGQLKIGNKGEIFIVQSFIGILFKNMTFKKNTMLLEEFLDQIESQFNIITVAAIGRHTQNHSELYNSYFDAKWLLDYKFIYGNNRILDERFLKDVSRVEKDQDIQLDCQVSQIYQAIELNQMTTINDLLEDMLERITQLAWQPDKIKSHYVHLYVTIATDLISKNPTLSQNDFLNGGIFDKIYTQGNLQKLHGFVKHQIVYMSNLIAENRPDLLIDKIKDYIERNYDKEIKIEDLGKIFNYNSSYLGKQFKQEVGMYFNTYVDIRRINKAKEMLVATNKRIYDIAKSVGFNDPDYFATRFKKYEKISPNAYRKKHTK